MQPRHPLRHHLQLADHLRVESEEKRLGEDLVEGGVAGETGEIAQHAQRSLYHMDVVLSGGGAMGLDQHFKQSEGVPFLTHQQRAGQLGKGLGAL